MTGGSSGGTTLFRDGALSLRDPLARGPGAGADFFFCLDFPPPESPSAIFSQWQIAPPAPCSGKGRLGRGHLYVNNRASLPARRPWAVPKGEADGPSPSCFLDLIIHRFRHHQAHLLLWSIRLPLTNLSAARAVANAICCSRSTSARAVPSAHRHRAGLGWSFQILLRRKKRSRAISAQWKFPPPIPQACCLTNQSRSDNAQPTFGRLPSPPPESSGPTTRRRFGHS